MHGPVREVVPLPVAFGLHRLEPDGEMRAVGRSFLEICDVPAIGDGDIPVHLDLDRIEITPQIGGLGNSSEPTGSVVYFERGTARRPTVPVSEHEIARNDAVEVGYVATYDRGFHLTLEGEDVGRRTRWCCFAGGSCFLAGQRADENDGNNRHHSSLHDSTS